MRSGRISGTNIHTGINVVVFVVMRPFDYKRVPGLWRRAEYALGGGLSTRINENHSMYQSRAVQILRKHPGGGGLAICLFLLIRGEWGLNVAYVRYFQNLLTCLKKKKLLQISN